MVAVELDLVAVDLAVGARPEKGLPSCTPAIRQRRAIQSSAAGAVADCELGGAANLSALQARDSRSPTQETSGPTPPGILAWRSQAYIEKIDPCTWFLRTNLKNMLAEPRAHDSHIQITSLV